MSVTSVPLMRENWTPGIGQPIATWYYVVDTDAELPAAPNGCSAVSAQSGHFVRVGGAWVQPSGGSGGAAFRAFTICGSGVAWTNQPAAITELFGGTDFRTKLDLAAFAQIRLVARVGVAGAATAVIRARYSTDETNWSNLTSNLAINTTGTKAGAWENIPAGAKADVFVQIVGEGGNATADPRLGSILVQVR